MNCAISGEVPDEPVVSIKSGLLFEKRLIERHIADYGKCPVTDEALTLDDIVPVKTGKIVKPRPVQAASIPGMLGMFQLEWDSVMLSNFALAQQLHTARQELSHALYQHDAACRVIARLKKERDEARVFLAQAETHMPLSAPTTPAVSISEASLSNGKRAAEDDLEAPSGKKIRPGVSDNVFSELAECNANLSQQRKQRQIPPTLSPVSAVEKYTQLNSYPLHLTNKPGILSLDVIYPRDIIATAGVDTNVVVFDRPSGEIMSTLRGHSKKVNCVKFASRGDVVLSGSADKTVRVWSATEDGNYDCRHILKDHDDEVQAVTVHAINHYFVTASLDDTWCFYDLSSGLRLTQVSDGLESGGYTSAAFHPDGLILGAGTTDGLVKIWDVKTEVKTLRRLIARLVNNGLELNSNLDGLCNKIRDLFNLSPDVDLVLTYMVKHILNPLRIDKTLRRLIARVVNNGLELNSDAMWNKFRDLFNMSLTYMVKHILNPLRIDNVPSESGSVTRQGKESMNKKSGLDNFPDDLIIEISSKLSIKDAMIFRCVCKQFRDLLGRPHFVNSHVKRSAPMIFVNTPIISRQYLLDMWLELGKYPLEERSPSLFHLHLPYSPELSHDGLIVSKHNYNDCQFVIFNPIYRGKVELVVPPGCQILGVFYHPLVQEYRTIWESTVSSEPLRVAYKVLNLYSQPNWREVMNPLIQNARIRAIAPVMLDMHLYWAVNSEPKTDKRIDIIEFDTINERFQVIPCPDNVRLGFVLPDECNVSLQKVNGCLVLIEISKKPVQRHLKVNIWTLEDRMNKKWSISSEYIFTGSNAPQDMYRVEVIALWDEELFLRCSNVDHLCNLRLIKTKTLERRPYFGDMRPHVMTLASLKDCNPDICVVG